MKTRERIALQLLSIGINPSSVVPVVMRVRRLAAKHTRMCEAGCNGEGYVGGKFYRLDGSTPGAYINIDTGEDVFDRECERLEAKIEALVSTVSDLTTEHQGDPRGYTIKLAYAGRDITHICFS